MLIFFICFLDKHKNAAHAEPPKVDSTDNEHEQLPLTYRTKDKFDYFKPKVEIETEDEGYKTHVKEIYIRGKFRANSL